MQRLVYLGVVFAEDGLSKHHVKERVDLFLPRCRFGAARLNKYSNIIPSSCKNIILATAFAALNYGSEIISWRHLKVK